VAAVERLVLDHAATTFDLSTGPLVSALLVRTGDDEHQLLVTQHHIVTDGWSIGVMVREIGALYAAFAAGRPDPLPPLALQYADYAAWQRARPVDDQLAFWTAHLQGAPALLELPTDRPRPAQQSHRGASHAVTLAPALVAGLRALSARHGTTLFMTLLAAWSLLLSRLSGQDDVVVGTPVANRPRPELEPLIGFFVNTLALRVRLPAEAGIADLLAQVRQTMLAAQSHPDLPFDRLVDALQPPRTLAHSPVFQAMFALDNTPAADLVLPGLRIERLPAPTTTTQFDLTLALAESGDMLRGQIEFAADLFDATTIARWAGHLVTLLQAFVDDDVRHVRELPLMSDAERAVVLRSFNATALPYPRDALLHHAFEQQALQQPQAIALVHGTQAWTYAELDARADALARHLRQLGVQPDDRVGVCARRCPELVVALLAILKAGAAYLPLDPAYPPERLAFMLADATPRAVLVTDVQAAQALLGNEVTLVSLFDVPEVAQDFGPVATQAAHLAYVIYTSGSTGRPKGVMLTHRNAVNFVTWARANFDAALLRDTLFATSINFDLAVFEVFVPLSTGTRLTLVDDAIALASVKAPVSLVNTVPSAIAALLDLGGLPGSVRSVNLAGEPLKATLIRRLFDETGIESIANLYGPTETTTYSTWVRMRRVDGVVTHIGRPLANTSVYLLDVHGQPVPVGVAGEIFIGGDGVARGYLNRPELTAERFLPDPFASSSDARMYRTGDLGRWLADGSIEYLGRNDFQVKLRGFRIELGEIESQLLACAGVRDASVLAREGDGGLRLVAYLAMDADAFDAAALRAQLGRCLADYMIPSAFVRLDAFPRTPNGKLDRAALPAPDADALVARAYEAPIGDIERMLAEVWAGLLGVERVGREDSFFDLGGHSLLAVGAMHRLNARLHLTLPLSALFAAPTVRALAEQIAAMDGATERADASRTMPLVALRPAPKGTPAVICVHPIGGDVACYGALAQHLPGFAVWGVGADGEAASARALADRQAQAVRGAAPGPYRLLGWSSGGRFALALAQALERAGERVEVVILLDTDRRAAPDVDVSAHAEVALLNLVATLRETVLTPRDVDELARAAQASGLSAARLVASADGAAPPSSFVAWLARAIGRPVDAALAAFVRDNVRAAVRHLALIGGPVPSIDPHTRIVPIWAGESALRHAQGDPADAVIAHASHHALLQPSHAADVARAVARALRPALPVPHSTRSDACPEIPG